MDAAVKTAGVCMAALCAALIIRDRHRTAAILCSVCALVFVLAFCIGGSLSEIVTAFGEIYSGTAFSEYAAPLVKALGIAYIVSISSEICKAGGEAALAYAVGVCGRIELLLLCVPMIMKLLETAADMLSQT